MQLRLRSCKLEHVDWCRKLHLMNRWQCLPTRAGNPGSRHKHKNGIDPVSSKNGECSKEVRAPQSSQTSVKLGTWLPFDFIMLVACDDEVQWDCMGVLHAANSLKRLTDLSAKPKMPLFLTFYQFYLGLGVLFSRGVCIWSMTSNSNELTWNSEQSTVSPQCCTSGACACTLRAVRRAVRLKTKNNQATSSNYRTVSSQWSFWTVAYCGVASLLLLALCTHIIPLQLLQTPQPLLSLLCLQPANACQLIAEHNLGSNHPKTGENQNISK